MLTLNKKNANWVTSTSRNDNLRCHMINQELELKGLRLVY